MFNIRDIALVAVICCIVYKYIIYPAFISPLSKIPNAHFTSPIFPFWIQYNRQQFHENRAIYAAHQKHGPVVRLGPNELSVNCVDNGLRSIYAGGFEKHEWYPNLFQNYNGVPNMFSTLPSRPHSVRKRMLSNFYSKSYLQSSPSMAAISSILVHQRLLPKLHSVAARTGQVEFVALLNAITMDMVAAYIFGLCNSTNFIDDEKTAAWWLDLYRSRKKFTFWPQEMPRFSNLISKFGLRLSPAFVAQANHDLGEWCLNLCDAADKNDTGKHTSKHPENVPTIYRQLKTSVVADAAKSPDSPLSPKQPEQRRISIASELLDEISAGEETSAITLTYLFHELCQHPELQESLRSEIRTLSPSLTVSSGEKTAAAKSDPNGEPTPLPSPKSIDALPLLHATLMETLRIHAAIPGPQPRITPDKPNLTLGPFTNIPANVRVSCSAHSLHRNPQVYPAPETFNPQRWLTANDAQKAEMHRWFWAFGSGGRMCIGSNLAMHQMKLIIVTLLSNFRFSIIDDGGIEQEDAYTAQPIGELVLRIQALDN